MSVSASAISKEIIYVSAPVSAISKKNHVRVREFLEKHLHVRVRVRDFKNLHVRFRPELKNGAKIKLPFWWVRL